MKLPTSLPPLRTVFFDDLKVGMTERLKKTIAASDVVGFARLTGDRNPIHLSEHFAARTPFGRRIAHGLYTASLMSAVLGTRLPGPGAIYISQTLNFRAPVKIGDTVTVIVHRCRADAGKIPRAPDLRLQGRPPSGARRRSAGESAARGKGQTAVDAFVASWLGVWGRNSRRHGRARPGHPRSCGTPRGFIVQLGVDRSEGSSVVIGMKISPRFPQYSSLNSLSSAFFISPYWLNSSSIV